MLTTTETNDEGGFAHKSVHGFAHKCAQAHVALKICACSCVSLLHPHLQLRQNDTQQAHTLTRRQPLITSCPSHVLHSPPSPLLVISDTLIRSSPPFSLISASHHIVGMHSHCRNLAPACIGTHYKYTNAVLALSPSPSPTAPASSIWLLDKLRACVLRFQ